MSQHCRANPCCGDVPCSGIPLPQHTSGLTFHNKTPETAHPDDEAVDRFAAAMKAKLAKKRAEGRGGWENKDECSAEFLSFLLREHVDKGDPVDVGNLAMMLQQRGERISPTPTDTATAGRLEEAMRYAENLAVAIHETHYSEVTQWRPLSGDLVGLLTQIDNMIAGLYPRTLTHPHPSNGDEVERLREAIRTTRAIVCDGALVGFNPLEGDWAERLYTNNGSLTAALKGPSHELR
ncbi:hypothetical protein [Rhizobium sp. BK251]|uniref:hypothetical protein n=1 Tax=Rhizobium sp. BK251 TaxID=2512125 RepID=UPI00104503F7|nr:hypothetical protein [Rhizobium sp. BK251]TCL70599.1 hypothetical protein EV286_107476 [Rhizobium sp. BK251]